MLIALLLAAATASTATKDFDSKGSMGLSFGVGVGPASTLAGSAVNTSGATLSTFAPTVGFSYFVGDGMALRAEFGFDGFLSSGQGPATLTLGLGLRWYQFKRNNVAVFLQPSVVLTRYRLSAVDAAQALTFAGGFGAEYLFTDRFSVSGLLALGFTIGNIGGPAGTSSTTEISTATSGLFANIYF